MGQYCRDNNQFASARRASARSPKGTSAFMASLCSRRTRCCEAGTPMTSQVVGLGAAARYLQEIGMAAVGSVLLTPWNLYSNPEVIHYTLDTLGAFIGPLREKGVEVDEVTVSSVELPVTPICSLKSSLEVATAGAPGMC